eukprot:TRINITY_DN4718_c0_g1_i2.p1 TRINITY_DN4718_c0_g1~~TRINITY_DN4718_c0_g1_i2.p1  ORF type:complete len:296 (+),score=100.79 TRINITY_DN4718_c0_g1_i2:317-1204(+)
MVAGMWWFFTLIMISSYTANLAAFLTAAKMDVPINSAEDLAKQTKIKYGTYGYGSTNSFFKRSTISTYQKLNAYMESAKPSVYTDGNSEGIDRVIKEDGAYAYFMESAAIEYNVERNCELTKIGGLLDSKGYGIALPPNSPYTRAITEGILSLQENGVLQRLKIKWWKEIKDESIDCGSGENSDSAQLGLPNLGGVFIVLLAGVIISCFIAVFEFTWKKRHLAASKEDSLWREMATELKFAMDCTSGDTKPISKSKSSINEDSKYGSLSGGGGGAYDKITKRAESPYASFNDGGT